ncbi:MAG: hypothetical protein Q6364_08945 [Candidatus Hermodarchaeota archaeon]|nr:hypothetical protein [Candidatus Hermodarchaeota archaeon]
MPSKRANHQLSLSYPCESTYHPGCIEEYQSSIAITIPGYLCDLTIAQEKALTDLMRQFCIARRLAFTLCNRGIPYSLIEKHLQEKTGLNSRYIKDAIYSVKNLPSTGVTFGGKNNQFSRMTGKISQEEYTKRRNSILISRGDKTKKGNLNLRVINENTSIKLALILAEGSGLLRRYSFQTNTMLNLRKY